MKPTERRVFFRSRPQRPAPVIVHTMRPVDTSRMGPVVAWDDPGPRAELHALLDRINAAAERHPLPMAHAGYEGRDMGGHLVSDDVAGLAGGRTWEEPCEG